MDSEPRSGILGYWDRLVGPTATVQEQALALTIATVYTVVVCGYAVWAELGWSVLQLIVVGVLAFDIAGGVIQ